MRTKLFTAIVICPEGPQEATTHRKVAGLAVGERLLLALAHAGVGRVLCAGRGERPFSQRADIRVSELTKTSLAPGERAVLLSADCVFDGRLLEEIDDPPEDLPLGVVTASAVPGLLSAPERALERLGLGRAGEAGRGFAIRVVDKASARRAEKSLLKSLRKPTDGIVSRHLNRRISLAVTRRLVRTGIRPNAITIPLMGVAIAAFAAAASGGPWWTLLLAGLLYQAHSILDGCDGEIARLTYRFSHLGQWLDSVSDALANYLFCLGLAFGQAHAHGWTWLYVVGLVLFAVQCHATGMGMQRGARMGTGDLLKVPNAITGGTPRTPLQKLLRPLHSLMRRDTYALITASLAAAQLPLVAFGLFAVGSVALACGMTVNELRLRAMEREGIPLPTMM